MKLLRPASLDEALALLSAAPAARPVAGGTDLLVSWHHHDKRDWTLLDLSRVDGLRGHTLDEHALTLGALTTYWDVVGDAAVSRAFPLLAQAARQVGAVQIQTRGTWAGNIANGSPAADGVPALLAYDARITLQSVRGAREIPLDEYFLGYKRTVRAADELIVAIRLPRVAYDVAWFHKVGARAAQTIAKVGVAVTRGPGGWRVAANSVAPFVCRCPRLEAALEADARFANPEDVQALLAADIAPIDDIRSTAAYRANVLGRLIYHWWQEQARAPAVHASMETTQHEARDSARLDQALRRERSIMLMNETAQSLVNEIRAAASGGFRTPVRSEPMAAAEAFDVVSALPARDGLNPDAVAEHLRSLGGAAKEIRVGLAGGQTVLTLAVSGARQAAFAWADALLERMSASGIKMNIGPQKPTSMKVFWGKPDINTLIDLGGED